MASSCGQGSQRFCAASPGTQLVCVALAGAPHCTTRPWQPGLDLGTQQAMGAAILGARRT
eukprot:4932283-Prymnesium_polylepis.3